MNLLAIECSSDDRSVAVARDGRILASASRRAGRSTPLFEMITGVLAEAGIEPVAIEVLALGLGPGSYTGIRGAIAAAQGWALARGTRLLGISSATACAHRARQLGHRGPTAVIIDAQRGEFYLATFDLGEPADHDPAPAPVALSPLRLATRADVEQAIRDGLQLVGPEPGVSCGFAITPVVPHAESVAALAFPRTDWVKPESLEPIYLRETAFVKAPIPTALPLPPG
jgi:tRNA threonylcarbamoyladenosine biosynthesis protein TsaB